MYQGLMTGGRPQTTLTNIVTNGNFASGTTGWTGIFAAIAAANNTLSVTGDGGNAVARVLATTSIPIVVGKKVYIHFKSSVTNAVCGSMRYCLKDVMGNDISAENRAISSPTQNQWYTTGGVLTINNLGDAGNIRVQPTHNYADAATANGKVMQVQEALAIDLTTIFGAGLEPTAAQMDRWLEIFSAGWFDTTKAIPKRIY